MNELPAAIRQQFREAAKTVQCRCCWVPRGEECVSPTTGLVLSRQPAHNVRLVDAGVFSWRGG